MVHVRINEKHSNPNPHINFITALSTPDRPDDSKGALELLRALAAQVKPVMKAHGFSINSLEEYEHNSVFAGRNWNNGETVELVLRRPNGTFAPTSWLLSTLCHELAHNLHMNHGPDFQVLWKQLRIEVRALQDKGFYGDGFWSSGIKLADSERVLGGGVEAGELPEYMCGGAQTKTRPVRRRAGRRRGPRATVPSNHTGRQTEKRRKAGSRVTSAYAFTGQGTSLNVDNPNTKTGTGFGKQAASKRAREERALAAERRIAGLQRSSKTEELDLDNLIPMSDTESDDEIEFVPETDQERRQTLLSTVKAGDDLEDLKPPSWHDIKDEFNFYRGSQDDGCEVASGSGGSFTTGQPTVKSKVDIKGKRKAFDIEEPTSTAKRKQVPYKPSIKLEDDIDSPTEHVKIEPGIALTRVTQSQTQVAKIEKRASASSGFTPKSSSENTKQWSCRICTLLNEPQHLACSACTSPRQ